MKVYYAVFDGDKRVSDKLSTRSMAVQEAYRIKPDWLYTRNDYTIKEVAEKALWFKEGEIL